jgi:hypothetical protein
MRKSSSSKDRARKKKPEEFRLLGMEKGAGNYFLLRGLLIQLATTKKHSKPNNRMAGVADFILSPWG